MFTKILILISFIYCNCFLVNPIIKHKTKKQLNLNMITNSTNNSDNRRKLLLSVYTASFIPYFIPDDYKPSVYKDGLSDEEIELKHKIIELNRITGGDIIKFFELFQNDL